MSIIIIAALFIGAAVGLRVMTPLAVISWAARLNVISLAGGWAAFLGYAYTPVIFTILAAGELINDKLPTTPSRKVPAQFAARIVIGAFCGAVLGTLGASLVAGLVAGALGSVIGTLGGAQARARLAKVIGGKDLPIALLEDLVALAVAIVVMTVLR
jgi:uncharacterized membrane protein